MSRVFNAVNLKSYYHDCRLPLPPAVDTSVLDLEAPDVPAEPNWPDLVVPPPLIEPTTAADAPWTNADYDAAELDSQPPLSVDDYTDPYHYPFQAA